MKILSLHPELVRFLKKRGLEEKFEKQKKLFEANPFHPGLRAELLEPKWTRIWSFRIDRWYRAIFIFREKGCRELPFQLALTAPEDREEPRPLPHRPEDLGGKEDRDQYKRENLEPTQKHLITPFRLLSFRCVVKLSSN